VSLLNDTLANADAILCAAKSDQRNISQALKMADAETVLGMGDDKLETLRWYVYPKECATALSMESPLSLISEDIVGALNPVVSGKNGQKTTISMPVSEEDEDSSLDRKRKLSEFAVSTKKPKVTIEIDKEAPAAVSSDLTDGTKKKAPRHSASWGLGSTVKSSVRSAAAKGDDNGTGPARKSVDPRATMNGASKSKTRHIKPPPKMMRFVTQAIVQWDMLENGDKLLLGLSGGKDSLTLLHCLLEFQRKLPIQFEIEVCTIDPMTPSFDPSPLIPYVESLGLRYHYIRDDIVSRASSSGKDGKVVSSLCAYCARMKRGNLYACARRNNCNKLVLAQHLDDCAESFMMSLMHNGFLRTMKANYKINAGDISVIRPLVYCRESLMTEFAKSSNLPVINENCPACFEEPKERARVKKMLSREETLYPNFYDNVRRSLLPLMHDDMTSILRCYMEETVAKSRKRNRGVGRDSKAKGTLPSETLEVQDTSNADGVSVALRDASDEELVRELARRRAESYRLSGAMKRVGNSDEGNAGNTHSQVCTTSGECTIFD
jgi:tRNA(Ile)-lysidine synthase TilS/MesJ